MPNAIVDKYKNTYLPHRSTETALTLIINDILISHDNKIYSCYLVLLDLSSNCDTLDHNICSIKLNVIGIHGQVHSWFMYFVLSRKSSVKINFSLSLPYVNIHGVPQGYVIGPIGLYIYIYIYIYIVHYLYSSYTIHFH